MERTALVLGAGGVLGLTWTVGTLPTVQELVGRPLGELDLLVGTSAGSVLCAGLRCGASVAELLAHQADADPADPAGLTGLGGLKPGDVPGIRTIERESGDGAPPPPRLRMGSPRLLLRAVTHPCSMTPATAASALLPLGRARLDTLTDLVHALQRRAGITPDGWVPGAPLWIAAVDYDTGRRTVFGRAGAPRTSVADAVAASCAIPGWFAPREIDGRRYVDGALASSTSVGALCREGLDAVVVLAPMASMRYDLPLDPVAALERQMRRVVSAQLAAEVRRLRATGTRVTVLTPGPRDLAAIGGNLMDPRRRPRVLATALESAREAVEQAVTAAGRASAA